MTVNVEKLILSLGKSYEEILDAEVIPYKKRRALRGPRI